MTQQNNLAAGIHSTSFIKRMLQGAGIALILIIIFLAPVDEPDPEWGRFWMVKPLTIVPLAGAAGGLVYFFTDYIRCQGGWKKVVVNIISLIVYIFGLWIGTVLGLNGTMWN